MGATPAHAFSYQSARDIAWSSAVPNLKNWSKIWHKVMVKGPDQAQANSLHTQEMTQLKQAGDVRMQMEQQPKIMPSDNFAANKARQLAQLRLGMGSTITGAGNPTLQPAPAALKSNMGS